MLCNNISCPVNYQDLTYCNYSKGYYNSRCCPTWCRMPMPCFPDDCYLNPNCFPNLCNNSCQNNFVGGGCVLPLLLMLCNRCRCMQNKK